MNELKERVRTLESYRGRQVSLVTLASRGFTSAIRAHVLRDDGSAAFIKAGVDEETSGWLRDEIAMYQALQGAPFMPELLDTWDDEHGHPVMLIEDLSGAHWPGESWSPQDIEHVLKGLAKVASWPVPAHALSMSAHPADYQGWGEVARDPTPFLNLGLTDASTLNRLLPDLLAAHEALDLDGQELVHLDVRSDNMCLVPGRGLVLVDWNWARRGVGRFDVGFWLPSLRLEGGPEPWEVLKGEPLIASSVSGYFCSKAGLPAWPGGQAVRAFQLAQARVAWRWVCHEFDATR